jgi:K+-transporting ATPase KdpF subunit
MRETLTMTENIVVGTAALLLLAYLFVALIRPELF